MKDNNERDLVLQIELANNDINISLLLKDGESFILSKKEKTLLLIGLHELKNKILEDSLEIKEVLNG